MLRFCLCYKLCFFYRYKLFKTMTLTTILLSILVTLGTFVFMEGVAWFAHKYIMHGFLWYLHEKHHTGDHGVIHRNDSFFLIFAIPSWLGIMLGSMNGSWFWVSFGAGIALYGLVYFIVHEVYIHRRLNWFKSSKNTYLRGIKRAHSDHHHYLTPTPGVAFGLLVVPKRYFKQSEKKSSK